MKTRVAVAILPLMLVALVARVSHADQAPTTPAPAATPSPVYPAAPPSQDPQAQPSPPPVQPPVQPPVEPPPPPSPPPPAVPVVVEPARVQPAPPGNDGGQLAAAGIMGPRERVTTWDLNLDGAYGRIFGDSPEWTGFGRVRVGVLHIRDGMYFMLGGTYEISDRIAATFGIQGEVMHLSSGFWAQVGGLLDIRPRPGFMGAVGWSLFGVEVQQRNDEQFGSVVSFYGKIRIPVRIIIKALDK